MNPETSSEPTQPDTPPATPDSGDDDGIIFQGVDRSLGKYLAKKWQVLAAAFTVMVALVIFLPGSIKFYSIVLVFVAFGYLRGRYEKSLFSAFAKANNFVFIKKADLNPSGIIFTIGHSHKYFDIVNGSYLGRDFSLYMFQYTVGSGRSSSTSDRAILSVDYKSSVTPFLLTHHHALGWLEDNIQEASNSRGYSQKVELEGDFSDHFDLRIVAGSQVEVLSILTPDIMELIMGLNKNYDVELTSDGELYIYCSGFLEDQQSLADVFNILKPIAAHLGRDVDRTNRLRDLEQAAANAAPVTPA